MSDLLSNCCAADFDALGYEKENGFWQERCLNCGKLCEPIMFSDKDIANIHRCVKWNLATIDDKPEKIEPLGIHPYGEWSINDCVRKLDELVKAVNSLKGRKQL